MTDVRRRSFLVSIAGWMTGLFVRQSIPKVLPTKLGLCQAARLSPAAPGESFSIACVPIAWSMSPEMRALPRTRR